MSFVQKSHGSQATRPLGPLLQQHPSDVELVPGVLGLQCHPRLAQDGQKRAPKSHTDHTTKSSPRGKQEPVTRTSQVCAPQISCRPSYSPAPPTSWIWDPKTPSATRQDARSFAALRPFAALWGALGPEKSCRTCMTCASGIRKLRN